MDLSTFIIAVFCSVGEFLGLDTDEAVFTYFGRHYAHFFPALREVHRITFARKAANLWKAKERLWQEFVALAPQEYEFSICDSMPLPACPSLPLLSLSGRGGFRQGRASQVNLPRLRIHARVSWPGVITRFSVAPANAHEISVLPEIVERTSGLLIGDRNYHSPKRREELYRMGIELLAPFSSKKKDPAPRKSPKRSALLSRFRYRILSLPHRHGFRPARRAVFDQTGMGEGHVASGEQIASQSPLSHRGLPHKPSHRQPAAPTLEVTRPLNLHIGLVSLETRQNGDRSPFLTFGFRPHS